MYSVQGISQHHFQSKTVHIILDKIQYLANKSNFRVVLDESLVPIIWTMSRYILVYCTQQVNQKASCSPSPKRVGSDVH